MDYKGMGQRIRKQREFLKMSREELAKKIGITSTFMADIELGSKGFSIKSLNRFCKELKMSSDNILFAQQEDKSDKYNSIVALLERASKEKLKSVEDILTLFLLSHDPEEYQ